MPTSCFINVTGSGAFIPKNSRKTYYPILSGKSKEAIAIKI
ncbi:hypothetical protein RintRC_0448 [Richelia intracellularis]|nr:hypothetical protein RintRC_0448 [Richelia intracellularis]